MDESLANGPSQKNDENSWPARRFLDSLENFQTRTGRISNKKNQTNRLKDDEGKNNSTKNERGEVRRRQSL